MPGFHTGCHCVCICECVCVCACMWGRDGSSLEFVDTVECVCVRMIMFLGESCFLVSGGHSLISRASYEMLAACVAQWSW